VAESYDFFVSYTKDDQRWAEWIAWHLEQNKYTTCLQAWDFRPGDNFVLKMQHAALHAQRTIAVLSERYLSSSFAQPEWASGFRQDPTGTAWKLVPVRVTHCSPDGLLGPVVYIDLVGLDETTARRTLLAGVAKERAKPLSQPPFPLEGKDRPDQPGRPLAAASLPATASVFPGSTTLAPLVPPSRIIGQSVARKHLVRLLDDWVGGRQIRGVVVVGEEGTGKSALIEETCALCRNNPLRIKLSGSSYHRRAAPGAEQFMLDLLAGLFQMSRYFDGEVLAKLDEFCEQRNLLVGRTFARNLRDALSGLRPDTDQPQRADPASQCDSSGMADFRPAVASAPILQLWHILSAYAEADGRPVVLWIEDAQLFPEDAEIPRQLLACASEPSALVALVVEFRANKTRDLTRIQERYKSSADVIVTVNLTRAESVDLVSAVLEVPRGNVPAPLLSDIFEDSGGNPKFIVDWIAYLQSENVISVSTGRREVSYRRPRHLSVPQELKDIAKRRLFACNLTEDQRSVLYFAAATAESDVPVSVLKAALGDGVGGALRALMADWEFLRDSGDGLEFKVRFGHLATKEATLEILRDAGEVEAGRLLTLASSALARERDRDQGSRILMGIVRELAVVANDANALASWIIYPVLYAKADDREKLRGWQRMFAHDTRLTDLSERVARLLSARLQELERKVTDAPRIYDTISRFPEVASQWSNKYLQRSLMDLVQFSCHRLIKYRTVSQVVAAERFLALRRHLVSTAPTAEAGEEAGRYVTREFCSESAQYKGDRDALYRALRSVDQKDPLSDVATLDLAYYSRARLLRAESTQILDSVDPFLEADSAIALSVCGSAGDGSPSLERRRREAAERGAFILSQAFLRTLTATSDEQQIRSAFESVVNYCDAVERVRPEVKLARVRRVAVQRRARALAGSGDYGTAIALLNPCRGVSWGGLVVLAHLIRIEEAMTEGPSSSLVEFLSAAEGVPLDSDASIDDAIEITAVLAEARGAPRGAAAGFVMRWLNQAPDAKIEIDQVSRLLTSAALLDGIDLEAALEVVARRLRRTTLNGTAIEMLRIKCAMLRVKSVDREALSSLFDQMRRLFEDRGDAVRGGAVWAFEWLLIELLNAATMLPLTSETKSRRYMARSLLLQNQSRLQTVEKNEGYWLIRWTTLARAGEAEEALRECKKRFDDEESGLSRDFLLGQMIRLTVPGVVYPAVYGRDSAGQIASAVRLARTLAQEEPAGIGGVDWLLRLAPFDEDGQVDVVSVASQQAERMMTRSKYSAAATVYRGVKVYLYRRGDYRDALLAGEKAIGALVRAIPRDWEELLGAECGQIFIRLSEALNNKNDVARCAELWLALLGRIEDQRPEKLQEIRRLVVYNLGCALVLGGKVAEALEWWSKLDEMPRKEVREDYFLVVCRLHQGRLVGTLADDCTLEVAMGVGRYWLARMERERGAGAEVGRLSEALSGARFADRHVPELCLEVFEDAGVPPPSEWTRQLSEWPDLASRAAALRRTDRTRKGAVVTRNAQCPCGSGKKFKRCHGSVGEA
jgi:hypothetical protein